MVTGNDDDVEVSQIPAHSGKEFKKHLLGSRRRISAVEDVARDQQRIDLFGEQCVGQPGKKAIVLMDAVIAMHHLSKVPVGGMENFHQEAFTSGHSVLDTMIINGQWLTK